LNEVGLNLLEPQHVFARTESELIHIGEVFIRAG